MEMVRAGALGYAGGLSILFIEAGDDGNGVEGLVVVVTVVVVVVVVVVTVVVWWW